MAAKLVVSKARGGSRITLVGTSGTELLSSKVFTEPRGKGATLRSLKGLLGEGIVVEDLTVSAAVKGDGKLEAKADAKVQAEAPAPRKPARGRTRRTATSSPRRTRRSPAAK